MKRFLSVLLCAALLLGLLPAVSPPARMLFTGFSLAQSATACFVGDPFWIETHDEDGEGPYKRSFDVYKGSERIVEDVWHDGDYYLLTYFSEPGTYKIRVWVWDLGSSTVWDKYSLNIAVTLRPSVQISKVEASGGTSLKLAWDAVSGASGYEVWRAKSKTGAYTRVKVTEAETFTNSWLTPGQQYFYKIRTYNNPDSIFTISGKFSAIRAGVPLAKPVIISAVGTSTNQVKLTWAKVTGATGYQVFISTAAAGTYKLIKATTAPTFTAGGMLHAKTYYFKVRAYKQLGTVKYYGPHSACKAGKTR